MCNIPLILLAFALHGVSRVLCGSSTWRTIIRSLQAVKRIAAAITPMSFVVLQHGYQLQKKAP